jgi:hypothetical protein
MKVNLAGPGVNRDFQLGEELEGSGVMYVPFVFTNGG